MFRHARYLIAIAVLAPLGAKAHFPFLHYVSEGGPAKLHVYFGETAEPDDPSLLDRIADSKVSQTSQDSAEQPLQLRKGESSLIADPKDTGPALFSLTKDYGVLTRGDESFHLIYYAKTYTGQDAWRIRMAQATPLEVVPEIRGSQLIFNVRWRGKPLPDAEIIVQGGIELYEGKTDAEGRYVIKRPDPELYSVRTKIIESGPGPIGKSKRHYATLTLQLE